MPRGSVAQSSVAALALSIALLLCAVSAVFANTTAQTLPFSQNWSNTGLITQNDNWNNVPGSSATTAVTFRLPPAPIRRP